MMRLLRCFLYLIGTSCQTAFLVGCLGAGPPLDLSSLDPVQDQRLIAQYYRHEAVRLHQKAHEIYGYMRMYERLFGADSEWVSGARLLALSYEDLALEHELAARQHFELATAGRASSLLNAPPAP